MRLPTSLAVVAVAVALATMAAVSACDGSDGAPMSCDPDGVAALSGCTDPPLAGECGERAPGQTLAVCQQEGGRWVVEDNGDDGSTQTYVVTHLEVNTDDPDCPAYVGMRGQADPDAWAELCTTPDDAAAQAEDQPYRPTTPDAQRAYQLVGGEW